MASEVDIPESTEHEILSSTAHRPWPLPNLPHIMVQHWHDLLFAHWPLPPEQIRPLIPPQLKLDTFDGKAWIGVIPFWMSHVHFRASPSVPTASKFPELNVRTYVRSTQEPEKAGVYFFSLDAGSFLAVIGARAWAGLPYFWATMSANHTGHAVAYRSTRRSNRYPAEFVARFRPIGPMAESKSPLERFVTERYCLYVVRSGVVHRIQIHHLPWPLQPAELELERNTMASASGIELPRETPILQFAKFLKVYIFPPERIG